MRRPAEQKDLLFVAGVVASLMVIFVPLPTPVVDLLLVLSVAVSLLTLLAVIYVRVPIQFSTFPSLLLLTTAYRLSLNVATTRLILTDAKTEGTLAAGRVVRSFGEFVAANEPVVGFVIFLVLVVVNFVVIARGSTRISEVAARFVLDALPGRQMAIDAELNAGVITGEEARKRRERLARETDFYGAMDGATKFVRGDAIAGLLITIINILGGLAIGTLQYGMPVGKALATFTILTIGDGLVAALPALVVSVAAGLMVTRSTAETNLGQEIVSQAFFTERKALVVAGVLLALLAVTALLGSGMPWVQLLAVGAVFFALARTMKRRAREEREREVARRAAAAPAEPEKVDALLRVDPVEVALGLRLVRHADALMSRLGVLRRDLASELGILVPPVVVREGERLEANGYAIKLRGLRVAGGSVRPGEVLALNEGRAREPLDGVPTADPIFGLPGWWIAEGAAGRARELGYRVVEALDVVAAHLREVIRDRAAELLTRDDVGGLLKSLREHRPAVVGEVVPALVKPGELQKVLQGLLREGVSIRDLGTILETVGDWAPRTKDPEALTEQVRAALGRSICQKYVEPDGRLYVIALDPRLEEAILASIRRTEEGARVGLEEGALARLRERLAREVDRMALAGHVPVILCGSAIRPAVRRLADQIRPGVAVLSYAEVVREIQVVTGGTVGE